ncbi:MAG TPA: DUF892 family protein, partial [Chitinophagaceae bacterium]|nr:DUF892 family protein [Chitinophagaceae bacterium]
MNNSKKIAMPETNNNNSNNKPALVASLRTLWNMESMLVEAMPRMIGKATHLGLRKSLALHLAETDQQKTALQAICALLDADWKGAEPDAGLLQILQEGEKAMIEEAMGDEMDARIIEGASKIEQHEIARYQAAALQAEELGYEAVAKRLRLTLEEEVQAGNKLRFMA